MKSIKNSRGVCFIVAMLQYVPLSISGDACALISRLLGSIIAATTLLFFFLARFLTTFPGATPGDFLPIFFAAISIHLQIIGVMFFTIPMILW